MLWAPLTEVKESVPRGPYQEKMNYCMEKKTKKNFSSRGHFRRHLQLTLRVAVISAKKHKRQRRKRQSVNAKREKSQTPKFLTAILTL